MHILAPQARQARQARVSGENLNYVTLAPQARLGGEILNYSLSCFFDILSMIIAPLRSSIIISSYTQSSTFRTNSKCKIKIMLLSH